MAKQPTDKMNSLPLIELGTFCDKCEYLNKVVAARSEGKPYDLGDLRCRCSNCKTGYDGIYKADIALQYLETKRKVGNVGKKKTKHRTHGKTVLRLKSEGKTLREISSATDLAVNTVRNILKEAHND